MFIVMDDAGDLYYDYSNPRVGRMLINESAIDMASIPADLCWEMAEEEEEEE